MSSGDGGEPIVVLELTDEQRIRICDGSGVNVRQLRYTPAAAAGVSLLATALAAGAASRTGRRLIELELTPAQAAVVKAAIGGSVPQAWVVDVDHARVTYTEDWSSAEPVRLGSRGLVVPEHATDPPDGELVVRMPTGLEGVFGTGRHAATQLAAQLLEEHLTPGDHVIDVGTGSGVLAVFAVRLGASHVRAIDTSDAAIEVAARTAELNGCQDRIDLVVGELREEGPPADLVVANILAGVLLDLLPTLAGSLRPAGVLVTSGVVDARAAEVAEAAAAVGLHHLRSAAADGWTASAFERRPA